MSDYTLNPELRAHFDSLGMGAVRADVMHYSYRDSNMRAAALAWLDEQDRPPEAWRAWLEGALVTTYLTVSVGTAIWLEIPAQVVLPGI